MTVAESPPMYVRLQALPSDEDGDHWQWTIYSYPGLVLLRNGEISGLREKAERAARAAVWTMGGVVKTLKEA